MLMMVNWYIEEDEINAILGKVDQLVAWASDIKEYAMQEALHGRVWEDWKVVEGRSIRKYSDEVAVAKAVEEAGYDPFERKLLTITAMEKLLGKKNFETLLGDMVVKPGGKPTLVPRSDKRPEMTTAINEFMEEN